MIKMEIPLIWFGIGVFVGFVLGFITAVIILAMIIPNETTNKEV